jgi:hypothetical protein
VDTINLHVNGLLQIYTVYGLQPEPEHVLQLQLQNAHSLQEHLHPVVLQVKVHVPGQQELHVKLIVQPLLGLMIMILAKHSIKIAQLN